MQHARAPHAQLSPPALVVEGLRKTYPNGTEALKGVSFTVEEGEFFGLLGPNGAGKTTLISILGGLATASVGRLSVCGLDLHKNKRAAARRLGIVPQEITFDPFLTVRETLRFQSGYWGLSGNDRWIGEILERLGLSDKADRRMNALSGGMKRRVLVAQALVHRPRIIVLDEPTAGVDVELRDSLSRLFHQPLALGATVILTTHYLQEAQAMCGRIAIMNKGELAALERTEDLLSRFEGRVLKARITGGDLPPALLPHVIRRHGPEVTVRVGDAADLSAKLAALTAAGVRLENLTVREADLEDVFLNITTSAEAA